MNGPPGRLWKFWSIIFVASRRKFRLSPFPSCQRKSKTRAASRHREFNRYAAAVGIRNDTLV
jgi:hypothetical protein